MLPGSYNQTRCSLPAVALTNVARSPTRSSGTETVHHLATVLVSHPNTRRLPTSLDSSFRHADFIDIDLVVASDTDDGVGELIATNYRCR